MQETRPPPIQLVGQRRIARIFWNGDGKRHEVEAAADGYASMVYGSNPETAASLRTADGHMKTSEGNNLPIVDGMFVAGDVRAAENPDLTALQTLFVREHNYQVDQLHAAHPTWSGDQLYENAKAIVAAEIANVTYSEFLPHLLGPDAITTYDGYDPNVDPRITEEFAGAAYRFGHSIVSADIEQTGEQGQVLGAQLRRRLRCRCARRPGAERYILRNTGTVQRSGICRRASAPSYE